MLKKKEGELGPKIFQQFFLILFILVENIYVSQKAVIFNLLISPSICLNEGKMRPVTLLGCLLES